MRGTAVAANPFSAAAPRQTRTDDRQLIARGRMNRFAALLLFAVPAVALACECATENASPEQAVKRAEVIVEVRAQKPVTTDGGEQVVPLKIIHRWKGSDLGETVNFAFPSSKCDFFPSAGEVAIIAGTMKDGVLHASLCEESQNLWTGRELGKIRKQFAALLGK